MGQFNDDFKIILTRDKKHIVLAIPAAFPPCTCKIGNSSGRKQHENNLV